MTQTFGRQADPGTAMPYTRLTDDHWWVQDRRSPYYNQMRLGSQGGFVQFVGQRVHQSAGEVVDLDPDHGRKQLRLWLASMAYVLLAALHRIALPATGSPAPPPAPSA